MRRKWLALTAHGRGLTEDLRDLGIHLDHQVLLDRHLGVAVLDLLLHPFVEDLAQDRCDDVADPLLGRLRDFELRLREILEDIVVLVSEEMQDFFDAQAIIPVVRERVQSEAAAACKNSRPQRPKVFVLTGVYEWS